MGHTAHLLVHFSQHFVPPAVDLDLPSGASIACCTVRVSNAANAGDRKKSDCCSLAEYPSSEAVTAKLGACLIMCAVSVVIAHQRCVIRSANLLVVDHGRLNMVASLVL